MITGINHINLSVRDLDEAFRFYRHVLGFRPLARWNRGAYFLAGESWVALYADPRTRRAPLEEYTHIAFTVPKEHFEAVAARIRASGASVWQPNTSEGA